MTYYQVSLETLALTRTQRAALLAWGLVLAARITVLFPSMLDDELANARKDYVDIQSAARLTLSSGIGAGGNILDANFTTPNVGNAPLLVWATVVLAVEHLYVSYASHIRNLEWW